MRTLSSSPGRTFQVRCSKRVRRAASTSGGRSSTPGWASRFGMVAPRSAPRLEAVPVECRGCLLAEHGAPRRRSRRRTGPRPLRCRRPPPTRTRPRAGGGRAARTPPSRRGPAETGVAGDQPPVQVEASQQCVVVEHLRSVTEPLAVDGVASEPAPDMVVDAAGGHAVERRGGRLPGAVVACAAARHNVSWAIACGNFGAPPNPPHTSSWSARSDPTASRPPPAPAHRRRARALPTARAHR